MNGVTILRSYEVLIGHGPGWSWGGLCLSILALAIIAISIYVGNRHPSQYKLWLTIAATAGLCAAGAIVLFAYATPIFETQYDAYISGLVDMTQFNRKYEIVSQTDLLYTLRLR